MRVLVCASEAPLPPLNGSRLVLRQLTQRLAARHEVCIVAFRWPDQRGEPPVGVVQHELQAPAPTVVGHLRDRALSLVRREPLETLRLCAPMARMVTDLRRHAY